MNCLQLSFYFYTKEKCLYFNNLIKCKFYNKKEFIINFFKIKLIYIFFPQYFSDKRINQNYKLIHLVYCCIIVLLRLNYPQMLKCLKDMLVV